MRTLLSTLFAVLDCDAWDIEQLRIWTDRLIAELQRPKSWLVELSASTSAEDALDVVRATMKEAGTQLPDDVGDLMVGLVLLRFDGAEIQANTTKRILVDLVDAYGAGGVDAEAAQCRDPRDVSYAKQRERAVQALLLLDEERLLEDQRILIGD